MTAPDAGPPPGRNLDAEQRLNLLDHLTWADDDGPGRWERAARHVAGRLPDRPGPTAQACRRAAGQWGAVRGRTALYRAKYDLLAELHPDVWLTFMNMGHLESGTGPRPADDPFTAVGSGPAGLYRMLADRARIAGDVLDLGCGRGGGTALLAGVPGVREAVGLDLAPRNVEFCARAHPAGERLRFRCGDAARLPFDTGSFDVVLTVESAHCFESLDDCLAEARRVLRPTGRLVFADEWPADRVGALAAHLAAAGLRVTEQADITAGVLRSIDALPPLVTRLLDALPPGPGRRAYERFYRTRIGDDSARLYRSGRCVYLRLTAVPEG